MSPEVKKNQSARQRILDYFLKRGPGVVVTKDELMQISGISEWARRVRELRDEQGWQISSFNDRPDLRPGEYVLETLERRSASPLRIPAEQRTRILVRDGSTCQLCGMGVGDPDPDRPNASVRLFVEHVVPIEAGGSTEDDNLTTICSICRQGRPVFYRPTESTLDVLELIRRKPRTIQKEVFDLLRRKFE